MASGYGIAVNNSRLKWQIDLSPSTVSNSTSSVNLRVRIWYCTINNWNIASSNDTLTFTGDISGTISIASLNVGKNAEVLIYDRTVSRTPNWGQPRGFSFTASVSGVVYDMNPSCSGSITIPARPYSVPGNATSVSATYIADTQARVSYTVPTSTGAPATGVQIQGEIDKSGSWYTVATVSGTGARAYTVGGLSKGKCYRWRVRPYGTAGNASSWVYTGYIYTTPTPVASLTAVKQSDTNIKLSWVQSTYTGGNNVYTRVFLDGSWAATANPGVNSYTITGVSGGAHTVEVAPLCAGREGARVSKTVQMSSDCAPPKLVTPVSGVVDPRRTLPLQWSFQSTDGGGQTRATIYISPDNTEWTLLDDISGPEQVYNVPANTIPGYNSPGSTWWWRVATAGVNGVLSAFTQSGELVNNNPSNTTITVASVVESATVDFELSIRAWGNGAQAGLVPAYYKYQITCTDTGEVIQPFAPYTPYPDSNAVVALSLGGLENNRNYQITAVSMVAVEGWTASATFRVEYPAPQTPLIQDVVFDEGDGSLSFFVGYLQGAVGDPAVGFAVQVFNGISWDTVQVSSTPTGWVVLPDLPLGESASVRVVSVSAIGAEAYSDVLSYPVPASGAYLTDSGGAVLRLDYSLSVSDKPGKPGLEFVHPLGAPLPVAVDNGTLASVFDLALQLGRDGWSAPEYAREMLRNCFTSGEVCTLRMPTYGVVRVVLSTLAFNRDVQGFVTASISCEQVGG